MRAGEKSKPSLWVIVKFYSLEAKIIFSEIIWDSVTHRNQTKICVRSDLDFYI